MILSKVMAVLGLAAASATIDPPLEVARAHRRLDITARWNRRQASRIQSAALDRIEFHESDPRPRQLLSDADHLRQALQDLVVRDRD